MIDQPQFTILVTNIFAIAEQVFVRQCSLFLQTIAADKSAGFSAEAAGLEDFTGEVDYQLIMDNGYAALETVSANFSSAWDKVDKVFLQECLALMPPQLPNLMYKINGEILRRWVDYVAGLPEENAFSRLHQYCQGLFYGGSASRDIIREAIADDNVALLEQNATAIAADDINFDDINTALMIESEKTFAWLAARAPLSGEQVLTMLEYVMSDPAYFARVYKILAPSAAIKAALVDKASAEGAAAVTEFLQQQ